ncbi:hypothetical protein [Virgibacillus salexigens]|uniref:Uncharacterized protein n=1 Tax=Virgibacillus kapii TaxID=1638645 RepID=A0ABQ2DX83_9BACI|nr:MULTISPECIES: hypothetical protein [Virgibacillus]MYL43929.1 hypothetical protein [Virgibacillus massiliensis]GGJ76990.1 hypothetical protein GCM10007111_43300 [Virgibacillus kapii]
MKSAYLFKFKGRSISSSDSVEESRDKYFTIFMHIYQPTKPGMNKPTSLQEWGINTSQLEKMIFNDKDIMLGEIGKYGNFEGVNPSN